MGTQMEGSRCPNKAGCCDRAPTVVAANNSGTDLTTGATMRTRGRCRNSTANPSFSRLPGCTFLAIWIVICLVLLETFTFAPSAMALVNRSVQPSGPSPCGRVLQPVLVRALSGGGQTYEFAVEGSIVRFTVPPASFRPLTASTAQLRKYGYGSRPTGRAALASWDREMSFYKRTVVPAPVIPCRQPDPQRRTLKHVGLIAQDPPPPTTYPDYNWAGFDAAYPSNSTAIVGVEGNYYQPTDGSCSCRTPGESTWVGLGAGPGGDGAGDLIQAGTAINQTYTNGNNPKYAGFYEWLGGGGAGSNGSIEIGNLGLSAGDAIYVLVEYDQSSSEADFYVADNTSGNFGPPGEVAIANAYYDGSTAEWVFERPGCSNGTTTCGNYSNGNPGFFLQNLANIGTGEFYTDGGPGAEALLADGDWETLGTLNSDGHVNKFSSYEYIEGGGGYGSAMLSTSTIHSDGESFAETWHLCE